jgi:hypothetical protein
MEVQAAMSHMYDKNRYYSSPSQVSIVVKFPMHVHCNDNGHNNTLLCQTHLGYTWTT